MKINDIIKKKRITLGMTQEQVADYLGVSTPAVNKWEKGGCYPDITLLPALARLLKVDLNTLLSFNDDLSEKEIGDFLNELYEVVSTKGFNTAYEVAIDKIQQFPNCYKLILSTATMLSGMICMFGVDNREYYEEQIEALYVRVLESEDLEVRNEATSMLINKYLERNEYKKAQSCIDKLPTVTYDKNMLQGRLYIKKGEFDKASELFSYKLIEASTDIFTILISMMEIALKDGRKEDAKYFAEILEKTTDLYDLWDYNGQVGYFQLYSDEKDADNFVIVLKKMLEAMKKPWNPSKSKLYANMKVNQSEEGFEQFIDTFVNTLKSDIEGELGFVKNNEEFNELINNI